MKRIIALVLVLLSLVPAASGESTFDLSSMTYEELVALKEQINLAIWNSQEWQEVEVPQGVWVVGEDIPAGKWTIKAPDNVSTAAIVWWGNKLDDSGVALSWDGSLYVSECLYNPASFLYSAGDATEVTWQLNEGEYIIVDDGIALFTPYAGKPSLGFK